jgi:hypothetical protein
MSTITISHKYFSFSVIVLIDLQMFATTVYDMYYVPIVRHSNLSIFKLRVKQNITVCSTKGRNMTSRHETFEHGLAI